MLIHTSHDCAVPFKVHVTTFTTTGITALGRVYDLCRSYRPGGRVNLGLRQTSTPCLPIISRRVSKKLIIQKEQMYRKSKCIERANHKADHRKSRYVETAPT